MKLGKTLYVTDRDAWRNWLEKHHDKEKEIWLIYYNKHTGKARIPYNDSVEEALCFGWIDSTVKKIDEGSFAQRFSPRRAKSALSAMNRERVKKLIKEGKMTKVGLDILKNQLKVRFTISEDILDALKKDTAAWKHFQKFPASYKRIRIGFIEGARKRPEEFKKRLAYFLKMTAANKKFGMVI